MFGFSTLRRKGRKIYDSFFCKSIKSKAKFGNRFIDTSGLRENSIIYSGGVGGEITFELALANRFKCNIYLFDPSETGFNTMSKASNQNPLIHYSKIGLNKTDSMADFLTPDDPVEGSFRVKRDSDGAGNVKQFECKSISSLMRENGHKRIDILKIDIEGFEYGVIEDIIQNKLDIGQICVEFHHFYKEIPKRKTKESIKLLKENGYQIIHKEIQDYTFIKKDLVKKKNSEEIQAEYYESTAKKYNELHVDQTDSDHTKALYILSSYISYYNIESILDIGSGTGRTLLYIKEKHPNIRIVGIEPIKELREQGYKKGLSKNELRDGNGYQLSFKTAEFDMVCEFGVLHHVRHPQKIVAEMLRIADKGVFISDSNNFGQGRYIARTVKQLINLIHLWSVYNFIKTKGKVHHISEGDGLFYSYSVYNNFEQINEQCDVFVTNTSPAAKNLYRTAGHIVLFGKKMKMIENIKLKIDAFFTQGHSRTLLAKKNIAASLSEGLQHYC